VSGRSCVGDVVNAVELLVGSGQPGGMTNLRRAAAHDEPFLRETLAAAADWRTPAAVRSGDEVMHDPVVAHYLAGWPLDGDFGVIADDAGVPVGAAWCRCFVSEPHGYGFVAPDVSELTIGVVTERRGRGIGRLLLTEVISEAQRRGIARISLSVEADNLAIDLYIDVGFVEAFRIHDSPTMVIDVGANRT